MSDSFSIGGQVAAEDVGPCPGCKATLAASLLPPSLLHPMPMCDYFRDTDIDQIAEDMRKALEASRRS